MILSVLILVFLIKVLLIKKNCIHLVWYHSPDGWLILPKASFQIHSIFVKPFQKMCTQIPNIDAVHMAPRKKWILAKLWYWEKQIRICMWKDFMLHPSRDWKNEHHQWSLSKKNQNFRHQRECSIWPFFTSFEYKCTQLVNHYAVHYHQ